MKNQILLLFFFISLTNCQFNDKNNEFEIVENQLRTHIQNNEWEDLFVLVKKYNLPNNYNEKNTEILKDISNEILTKYKDYELKKSIGRKDTVIYGFILNSTQNEFRTRISELRKENNGGFVWGTSTLSSYFYNYEYSVSGYEEHLMMNGVECDLIIQKNKKGKINSIRLHHFNCKYESPLVNGFNDILSSNYGEFTDIPSSYSKTFYWRDIYDQIRKNDFNVFKTYFLSNEDVFKYEKYKSHNEIIFNPNFVVFDDSMSPRIMTYELFFEEYEGVVNELKKELKKSEKIIF